MRNIWVFSPLVPSKREKNISVLLNLYIFWKIEKWTHFPQKIYKLSKTNWANNYFFSHFEGTRGEKIQIFRHLAGVWSILLVPKGIFRTGRYVGSMPILITVNINVTKLLEPMTNGLWKLGARVRNIWGVFLSFPQNERKIY